MNHSAQREAILAQLRAVTCHPTADELHGMLRKQMPQISLGTVYRNLELLSKHGIVLKLYTAGSQKRFDGNVVPHHHMRCRTCDRVFDLDVLNCADELNLALKKVLQETGCFDCHLELTGICMDCQSSEEEERENVS